MRAEYIKIDPLHPDLEAIRHGGDLLRAGGLVAFPTETVYGLGGDALAPLSAEKIYAAKGRPSDNPLIVHIANLEALGKLTPQIPKQARLLADRFWPGPLTMIFSKSAAVPLKTTGGLATVAVRCPKHAVALALIEAAGGYVAAPSANASGRPSPTTAAHVLEDLGETIDLVLDAGPVGIGLESTIVDLSGPVPQILRPGYITREALSQALNQEVGVDPAILSPESQARPKAPGMKYRHYAPKAQVTIVEGSTQAVAEAIRIAAAREAREGKKVKILSCSENARLYPPDLVKVAGSLSREDTIAHNLYDCLRSFDLDGVEVVFSEAFHTKRLGFAIMNRLQKAAGQRVVLAESLLTGKS